MSNSVSYYFGAYLEIKVKKVERTYQYKGCENGHRDKAAQGSFCSECGSPVGYRKDTVMVYPTFIVDHLIGDEYENVLRVITPQGLYGKGVILARGNKCNSGVWLVLDRYDFDVETKPFPAGDEIVEMKSLFLMRYIDIFNALRQSENVVSVEVKAGYVLNAEY